MAFNKNIFAAGLILFLISGCNCAGTFGIESPDGRDIQEVGEEVGETEEEYTESREDTGLEDFQEDFSVDVVPDTGEVIAEVQEEELPGCEGEYAYLHGDLWPMWYNMRVACDPEHKAWWRCERIHGEAAPECAPLQSHYDECISTWGTPWPCLNWGVCAPIEGTECGVGDPPEECDTRTFDYDSEEIWGSYYGLVWGSHTDLHRFLTIHIKDSGGSIIIAFSARPGSDEAYMGGMDNFGIGPDPQGFIQIIRDSRPEKFTDKFGSFACIRLPTGVSVTLWAAWMNEFCHTCGEDYASYPDTPCWTEEITMSFEGGKHYLWTERGIEPMETCSGPPPDIAARLPDAVCDTTAP